LAAVYGVGASAALIADWDNAPVGRHSAPDEQHEYARAPVVVARPRPGRGRHHSPDDDDHLPERAETGTHADLRLLRENPALRARCAAAMFVPFLLYTAMLVVIDRVDTYLLWLWIPTVIAGVGVGIILDVAHRRTR
jgi:hypothetical protein